MLASYQVEIQLMDPRSSSPRRLPREPRLLLGGPSFGLRSKVNCPAAPSTVNTEVCQVRHSTSANTMAPSVEMPISM